jgi:hypothetical protein
MFNNEYSLSHVTEAYVRAVTSLTFTVLTRLPELQREIIVLHFTAFPLCSSDSVAAEEGTFKRAPSSGSVAQNVESGHQGASEKSRVLGKL